MLCYVIYVCVCSCLCACMHCINVVTCVCAHAHIYRSVDLWICQSIDLSIYFPSIHVSTVNNDNYTHMCSHVCMYMAICIFLYLYMYLYVRVYVICVYMHDVYLHVYVFVNTCKRMQMISLYLYVHIYIYISYTSDPGICSGELGARTWHGFDQPTQLKILDSRTLICKPFLGRNAVIILGSGTHFSEARW